MKRKMVNLEEKSINVEVEPKKRHAENIAEWPRHEVRAKKNFGD
jgi:hypothetical protein